jgi:hypothetical protein
VTKIYDALCTRCGEELEFPEVALAPESQLAAEPRADARTEPAAHAGGGLRAGG